MSSVVYADLWTRVQGSLVHSFGDQIYQSWLRFLKFQNVEDGRIVLSVPSRFLRDWIMTRYADQLLKLLRAEDSSILTMTLVVTEEESGVFTAIEGEKTEHDESLTTNLDVRYKFDNFVVGKPNELAYAAAQRVASADSVYFNPLFLYGGVGLGKTHLMHAIAWSIAENHKARKVLYMSAEQFMHRFVMALRHKDIMEFREQFRSVDVLMIDDVQFISGKDSTQEEFFHTFNALVDKKRQIVISADKSPSDLEGMQERIRSRLGWGLVADVHPTTYELRLGILQAKVEKLSIQVPNDVLEFLAYKITSNIRELEGALNRMVAQASLVGRDITLSETQLLLKDLLRANERYYTIEEIQKRVADHFHLRISDMHSTRRLRAVVRPRQMAMYLCKRLTTKSLPEIGRNFGGRDHTTVMHAVRAVEILKNDDPAFREDLEIVERGLNTVER